MARRPEENYGISVGGGRGTSSVIDEKCNGEYAGGKTGASAPLRKVIVVTIDAMPRCGQG